MAITQYQRKDTVFAVCKGPDWVDSVIRIPDGAIIDISARPVSMGGYFADLYAGFHPGLGMKVALKRPRQLTPEHIRRFFREGHTWSRLQMLQHPHILPFLGVSFIEEQIHLIAPFMENGTLDQYLAHFPAADRVNLLRQAAGAVTHMHDLEIFHGDIKANNILVTVNGRVMLCDFGLAEITELQGVPSAYSSTSCGNVRWAAPELLEGHGRRSAESDVWAFGMTIYEVVHGMVPFYRLGKFAVYLPIVQGKLPEPEPDIAPDNLPYQQTWRIFESCCRRKPSERPSMSEIAYKLRKGTTAPTDVDDQPSNDDDETVFGFERWTWIGSMITGAHPEHGLVVLKPFCQSPKRRKNGHPRPDFETEVWASLHHPNVLPFLGICVISALLDPYLMSPYMEQGTVSEYTTKYPGADKAAICVGIGNRVAYLHEELIVPGNLRADNVLMSGKGRPLIAGFSSAIVIGGAKRHSDMSTMVSYRWSSPEVIREGTPTFHSDVYAFGMVIYEILCNKIPFDDITDLRQVKTTVLLGGRPTWDVMNATTLPPISSGAKKVVELEGHTGNTVVFSANGSRLASGMVDCTVQMWDAASGAQVATLRGHTKSIGAVAFSSDGLCLASGSLDLTVRIWDTESGTSLMVLHGHTGEVKTVAFSPDGSQLATGSRDSTVRVWDATAGKEIKALYGHGSWINSVAFSPDGMQLASGWGESIVRVWDATSGTESALMRGRTDEVSTIAFAPDGSRLASGSFDCTVRVWDAAFGTEVEETNAFNKIRTIAFSPNGYDLAYGTLDATVGMSSPFLRLISNWHSAPEARRGHTGRIENVLFSPKGDRLASVSDDSTVRVWNMTFGWSTQQVQEDWTL